MDVSEVVFDPQMDRSLRESLMELVFSHELSPHTEILIPTEENNDLNGSQHVEGGGTDFTYREANRLEIESARALGYYEYFAPVYRGSSVYTGNQYHGTGDFFGAVVVDPPAYAVSHWL